MNIYIACGLTHVPRNEFDGYVDYIENLGAYLSELPSVVTKYALKDSDPQLADIPLGLRARYCYLWDKDMVEWADFLIADASYPSVGLGIELQIACSKRIPTVLVFRLDEQLKAKPVRYCTTGNELHDLQIGDGFVSLMALGMPSIIKVIPYSNSDDAYPLIKDFVCNFNKSNIHPMGAW